MTGNFPQKDFNDGVINKQKQKSTVGGEVTNDLKDQDEDHVFRFIKMYEENSCLWDVLHKDYTKRNVKEITYSNLTNVFETKINSIKTIINGHRSQLGCKLAKERKTKNEQSTDVTYTRIFVHYGHLDFLLPVMRAAENKDVLKLNAENMGQEEIEPKILQTVKRGYTAERKVDLQPKCTDVVTANSNEKETRLLDHDLCFEFCSFHVSYMIY